MNLEHATREPPDVREHRAHLLALARHRLDPVLEGTFAHITDETVVISPTAWTTAHVIGLFHGTAKGVPCDAVITG